MNAQAQWYYANARNEHQGPVAAKALLDKLEHGELTPQTLVWRDGMAEWQPFSAVQAQLQAAAPANMPEPPAQDPIADTSTGETAVSSPAPSGATGVASTDAHASDSPYAAPASAPSAAGAAVIEGGEIVYAGFWNRFAANLIDSIIVSSFSFVLTFVVTFIFGIGLAGMESFGMARDSTDSMGDLVFFLLQLGSMGLTCAYYVWFHTSKNMATLGKMAVGIKVVRLNGERISTARAIGRYFALILSSLTMGIGMVMAAFTQRKQALHDMMCDTLVVDKWAFTDRPDLQQRGLKLVTVVVLVIFGGAVLVIGAIVGIAMLAAVAAIVQHG